MGDNVGDVAGMGADIFESYVGSIIATIAIGATVYGDAFTHLGGDRNALMTLPLSMAVVGLLASFLGIFSMKVLKNSGPQNALRYSGLLPPEPLLPRPCFWSPSSRWSPGFSGPSPPAASSGSGLGSSPSITPQPHRSRAWPKPARRAMPPISFTAWRSAWRAAPCRSWPFALPIFIANHFAGLYGIGIAASACWPRWV